MPFQLFNAVEWLLLIVVSMEMMGFLADESEHPQRSLPWAYGHFWKTALIVTVLAVVAFHPFVKVVHFTRQFLLPNVFGQIGIYSAR